MRPKSEGLLWDIEDAARYIIELTNDIPLDEYLGNRMLRQAVERNFEIIGEATHQLRDSDRTTARRIHRYKNLIELRNSIIHNFGEVDDHYLYRIAHDRLPELVQNIDGIRSSVSGRHFEIEHR